MKNHNSKLKIDIRHRAYLFAVSLVKLIDEMDMSDVSCQVIAKQLVRSATSIGANILEAQAGSSKKDFAKFMNYALKSANETKFWLALLRDTKKIRAEKCNAILKESLEIANILGASMLTLKGKR